VAPPADARAARRNGGGEAEEGGWQRRVHARRPLAHPAGRGNGQAKAGEGLLNGAHSERLVVSSGRLLTATCGKYHVMEIHASESVRALQGCHLVVKLRMVDSTTCPQRLCIYK